MAEIKEKAFAFLGLFYLNDLLQFGLVPLELLGEGHDVGVGVVDLEVKFDGLKKNVIELNGKLND